jgi:hypothetical protein
MKDGMDHSDDYLVNDDYLGMNDDHDYYWVNVDD